MPHARMQTLSALRNAPSVHGIAETVRCHEPILVGAPEASIGNEGALIRRAGSRGLRGGGGSVGSKPETRPLEGGVMCELVSESPKFPASREKTGLRIGTGNFLRA
jgi:hypothetical protein